MDRTIEIAEKAKFCLMNEIIKNDISDEDYEKIIIYLRCWLEAEATFFKKKGDNTNDN